MGLVPGGCKWPQHDANRFGGTVAFVDDMVAPRVIAQPLRQRLQTRGGQPRRGAPQPTVDLIASETNGLGRCEHGVYRSVSRRPEAEGRSG